MAVFFKVDKENVKKLSLPRLITAVVLLGLLFVAAVYTGRDPDLAALYAVMTHGVELALGAVLGLLVGEAATS